MIDLELYSFITNGFLFLMMAVLIRYSLYRVRFFLHMFQQNGYKLNEMARWISSHLLRKVITAEHIFFNILIFAMFYYVSDRVTLTAGTLIMGIFAIFWFIDTSGFKSEQEKKPFSFTPRMIRLTTVILIPLALIWYYAIVFGFYILPFRDFAAPFVLADPYFLAFSLILIDMMIPMFLLLGGLIIQPVEKMIQNGFKKQARKKLASLPHLKVIAITGSYGKTSTKFAIDTLLKERYQVCVTPGSFNTPMGICKVINNDLNAQHEILILEMGARYEGNIRELCKIARPDISVITNIGVAHLETFGSKEAIIREKSTLAAELKPGGTLVLNGDDPNLQNLQSFRDDIRIISTGNNGTVTAEDIIVNSNGTSFTLAFSDENGTITDKADIQTPLLGEHNIQNILLAAAVARGLDIRPDTISLATASLKPVEHRLELKHQNGLTIIDDAFNSNPVGAGNAVALLSSFPGERKIIITPGMIELGEIEADENKKFGQLIGSANIDLVILVGAERTKPILKGIQESESENKPEVKIVESLFEANRIMKEYAKAGDIILYENDLPDSMEV